MGDSEISLLCQRLYARHKRAFDLINKQIEVRTERRRSLLYQLVHQSQSPSFAVESGVKGGMYTRFLPSDWDRAALRGGKGWTKSKRILLFEFVNHPDSLRLALCIGPGPQERRHPIYELAAAHEPPFNRTHQGLHPKYHWLFWRQILTSEQIVASTDAELEQEIRRHWAEFLHNDLPAIDTLLRTIPWIWQSKSAPAAPPTTDLADEEADLSLSE
ncbi:MAG: hypothetical protein EI684_07035 [Candidatus Viridilinea halotolerans]|uniref:Uncharacterized protein n=1 Tax=Candidatus Viridilinea halotolerans TaxID=2491704 RepID=A0A426U3Q2_9CHLR|nr:MAG: hypothetical protein EI684_07035 [Candidatus Viridilinea halotolerans]